MTTSPTPFCGFLPPDRAKVSSVRPAIPQVQDLGTRPFSDTMMSRWVDVVSCAELARQHVMEIEAEGVAMLLYDIVGTAYATAAVCPHHAAWLSQGGLDGDLINCPRHQGQFHVPTGRKTRGPECPDLRTYPVRVENGRVWVNVA